MVVGFDDVVRSLESLPEPPLRDDEEKLDVEVAPGVGVDEPGVTDPVDGVVAADEPGVGVKPLLDGVSRLRASERELVSGAVEKRLLPEDAVSGWP